MSEIFELFPIAMFPHAKLGQRTIFHRQMFHQPEQLVVGLHCLGNESIVDGNRPKLHNRFFHIHRHHMQRMQHHAMVSIWLESNRLRDERCKFQ